MKNIYMLCIAILFTCGTAIAQKNEQKVTKDVCSLCQSARLTAPLVAWFNAEGNNYYMVSNCTPNSGLGWYTETWGGRLLKTVTSNAIGEIQLKEDSAFHPAFVLSILGKGGNAMVGYTNVKEFSFNNVSAIIIDNKLNVAWDALVTPNQPIIFEILKALPGEDYKVIETFRPIVFGVSQKYTYITSANEAAYYRILVRNTSAGERYITIPLAGRKENANIYPTVAKDVININVESNSPARYIIIGIDGKLVREGSLLQGVQTVSISDFASGTYLISVRSQDGVVASTKVVKQ